MKNRIGLLLWILLMTAVYACNSDKGTSAESSTRIESPVMEVDETPDNNESITANKTGTKADDKKNSSTMFGKKGSMKGGLPSKTFRVKGGMVNTVKAGMVIVDQKKHLVRGYIDLGEGRLLVQKLLDDKGGSLGYVMPRLGNNSLVGDITITSNKVLTEHGIRIGDTYSKLKEASNNLKVDGSNSEGRTYATADGVAYRLGTSALNSETTITEIVIKDILVK